jgi:transcriptional regulator with XRE-family HTH domain
MTDSLPGLADRLGAEARRGRLAQRLTQADVAERVGLSVEFYARIERGHALPSVPTLAALVRVLGLSTDAVLGAAVSNATEAIAREPVRFYELGSPVQRRIYRRLQRASPALLRLVHEVLTSFDRAVEDAAASSPGSAAAWEPADARAELDPPA